MLAPRPTMCRKTLPIKAKTTLPVCPKKSQPSTVRWAADIATEVMASNATPTARPIETTWFCR